MGGEYPTGDITEEMLVKAEQKRGGTVTEIEDYMERGEDIRDDQLQIV